MHITIDDLSGSEIYELLQEHLQDMALHSPPESVHALDIEALRKPEITFWTVWETPATRPYQPGRVCWSFSCILQ